MFGRHSIIPNNQIGTASASAGEDHVSASATSGHIPYDDMEEIPHPDSIYGAASDLIPDGSQLVAHRSDGSELLVSRPPEGANQLTISFRGQVYVFDAVGADKVILLCPSFVICVKSRWMHLKHNIWWLRARNDCLFCTFVLLLVLTKLWKLIS